MNCKKSPPGIVASDAVQRARQILNYVSKMLTSLTPLLRSHTRPAFSPTSQPCRAGPGLPSSPALSESDAHEGPLSNLVFPSTLHIVMELVPAATMRGPWYGPPRTDAALDRIKCSRSAPTLWNSTASAR